MADSFEGAARRSRKKRDQSVRSRSRSLNRSNIILDQPTIQNGGALDATPIHSKLQSTKNNTFIYQNFCYEQNAIHTEFHVLVDYEPENSDNNSKKRINELKLYQILKKLNLINNFKCIKRIGFRRCKIQYTSATDANLLASEINKDCLKENQLRAFIPSGFIFKFGVIRDIPKDFTDQEILENIQSDIKIKFVNRLTRADIDNKEVRLATKSVKIAFIGNIIPKSVSLFSINKLVDYFIPKPRSCNKCGKLGHVQKTCKSTRIPCLLCGSFPKCVDECKSEIKCILCGSTDHTFASSSSSNCMKKKEQADVNRIMSIGNLSFKEVKEKYNTSNPFEILTDKDYDISFPEMEKTKKQPNVRNNQDDINYSLRKNAPFNKVIKQKPKFSIENNLLPVADNLDIESQSAFSVSIDKCTEAEKFINTYLRTVLQTAIKNNDKELSEKIHTARNILQHISLANDVGLIKSLQSSQNSSNTIN